MVTPYLPPGWTQERLDKGLGEDFFSLSEEDLDRVLEYQNAHYGIQSGAEAKPQLRQRQSVAREQQGKPPRLETPLSKNPTTSRLVDVVERKGFEADWGFLLFRLDYSDDDLWEKFEETFIDLIEKSIEEDEKGSTGIGRIEEGLIVKMVVDQQMKDARMDDIPGFFHGLKEAGEVPPGLDVSMCLAADKESMMSIANGDAVPFVVAVDVNHDPTNALNEEGYEGHFKVAISSVLTDLYPPLAGVLLAPEELWPFAKPIFEDAYI